jgi:AraC-like DNA-binding protein
MLQKLIDNGHVTKSISLPRARHPLHAMPTSAGYDLQTSPSYVWDGRARGQTPFTVLQHTISGMGTLRYENRMMKVRPGEAMLVIVPHNHRYWLEPGDNWEFFWISMHGREALRIHEMILSARGPIIKLSANTINKLAQCCLKLVEGQGETPGAASAIAYEASMALFDDTFAPAEIFPSSEGSLARAVQYVGAHLNEDLNVDILAKVAGLSRAHFSRSFAEMTGLAPARYVMEERMRRAAKLLLANRDVSVKQVAALAGISDSNYFTKVFRRTYGVSPTDFRTTGMYATNR